MNITEKLRRLTEDQNKAGVARKAGLKPTQLNDYTSKGFKPRYDIALRIGRALGVSIEWLLDDSADWPPPALDANKSLIFIEDDKLMAEVARRQRLRMLLSFGNADDLEKMNWNELWGKIEKLSDEEAYKIVGGEIASSLMILQRSWHDIEEYNPLIFAARHHSAMPGNDRPMEDYFKLKDRLQNLLKNKALTDVAERIWQPYTREWKSIWSDVSDKINKEENPSPLALSRLAKVTPDFLNPPPPTSPPTKPKRPRKK